jgi:hypothetical protein
MSCDEFAEVAAELALGVLTGRERAEALAHLETCDNCRETVRQLSMTGEDLAGLLPAAEPPAGFEARVLSRIGIPAPVPEPAPSPGPGPGSAPAPGGRLRRSRRLLAVAAVVAVLAGGAGGWGLRAATAQRGTAPAAAAAPVASSLTPAPLLSVARQRVGTVFYYQGNPRWMYMVVDLSSGQHGSVSGTVTCQLAGADGHYTTVGTFRLTSGYGGWGGPDPGIEGRVTGARLLAASGKVLATARFS